MRLMQVMFLVASLFCGFVYAQPNQALVEKVRFCTAAFPCFGHTQSEYRQWNDHNVAPEKQKNTYISRYVEPPRWSVEHFVFLSAGQRLFNNSANTLITGQEEDFHTSFDNVDEEEWENINPISIARNLYGQHRNANNTFVGMAFDARFNRDFTPNNKIEIVNAYYDWFRTKYIAGNLKSIYLAGFSRGGALVLHLAERFKRELPQIPLIVHLVDPVLNLNQGELGAIRAGVPNPLNPGRNANLLNFDRLFPNRNNLAIYNFITGADVTTVELFDTHAVAHTGAGLAPPEETDLGWYIQRWYNMGHEALAAEPDMVARALDHLNTVGDNMIDVFCASQPPTVSCTASPLVSFGSYADVTFTATARNSDGSLITDPNAFVWTFDSGAVRQGPGPHQMGLFRLGTYSTLSATVTVTGSNGISASRQCSASIVSPDGDGGIAIEKN